MVIAVALKTLRAAWSRFRAANAADGELPLVRGGDTDDDEDAVEETADADAPVAEGDEDRSFRNSASFAARA